MNATTPLAVRLLAEQRKRCLATILSGVEAAPWWAQLPTADQEALRGTVRGALAVFYDFTRDVLKVADDDGTSLRNDLALDLIRSIHVQQQQIVEQLRGE